MREPQKVRVGDGHHWRSGTSTCLRTEVNTPEPFIYFDLVIPIRFRRRARRARRVIRYSNCMPVRDIPD
jgi:hypothetical protein